MTVSSFLLRCFLFPSSLITAASLTLAMASPAFSHEHDTLHVVASIKPIHSITSAIMQGVGEPVLLVDGASSPHNYSLRPSEARALRDADLVIYVSHTLERFLSKPLESLSGHSHQLELISTPDMALLEMREGGAWDAHIHDHGNPEHKGHAAQKHGNHQSHKDHGHGHDEHAHDDKNHHAHEGINTHIWMNPVNGAAIAIAIADELAEIDPEHANDYHENLQTLLASIEKLGNDLRIQVTPIQNRPYVVFHDAYQYLEFGFGLNAVGSITVSPDQKPGARRLHEIEDKIRDTGAVCIFAEPQFRPAIVRAVVSDTGIRTGTLDPLGANIVAGPSAYQEILKQNIDALVDCLGHDS